MTTDALDRVFTGMNCFPTTPFDEEGRLAPDVLPRHVDWQLTAQPSAIFPICGTGEYWSLTWEERLSAVSTVIDHVGDQLPVVAGWGGATPHDMQSLGRLADLGVDGLLMMPPTPWPAGPDGTRAYHLRAAEHTDLPRILYIKNSLGCSPEWWTNLAGTAGYLGIKDGTGDLDFVTGLMAAGWPPDRLLNGTPTAEWLAPAYRALGIRGWSSAILNFAPRLAAHLRTAILEGDTGFVAAAHERVVAPFGSLRRQDPGYAISLVKAAVRIRGFPVGRTRAPLSWPRPETQEGLHCILANADQLADSADQDVPK